MRIALITLIFASLAVLCAFTTPDRASNAIDVATQAYALEADDAFLANFAGRSNGKCCKVGAGGVCAVINDVGCTATLPWSCTCKWPGKACHSVVMAPVNHDTCAPSQNDSDYCALAEVTRCYRLHLGVCDDDAGGWSFGGFCFTCGCDLNGGQKWFGAVELCVADSTHCSDADM